MGNSETSTMHNFGTGNPTCMKLDKCQEQLSQIFSFKSGPDPITGREREGDPEIS